MMRPINYKPQKGVALLESLVALLVVALGVLGILSLQIRTMANAQTSVRQAQAIRLVENLSERVRMNPNSFLNNVASGYIIDWNSVGKTVDCSQGCAPKDLAESDVAVWKQSVLDTLPLADAKVFFVSGETGVDEGARRQLGVLIAWRESESAKNAGDDNYSKYFKLGSKDISGAEVKCPAGKTCYLQFIQLVARCVANDNAGPDQSQVYCADGGLKKIS